MDTLRLHEDLVDDILFGDHDRFEVVEDVEYAEGPLHTHHSITIKDRERDEFWQTTYRCGVNASDDFGTDWDEIEGHMILFAAVRPVRKTIIEYVRAA